MGQALEEGEEGDNYAPVSNAERERLERARHEGLWGDNDEEYYNDGEYLSDHRKAYQSSHADVASDRDRTAPNQKHWHYPANFEGAEPPLDSVCVASLLCDDHS